MPVTIKPSAHGASTIDLKYSKLAKTATEALKGVSITDDCRELLQSSLSAYIPANFQPVANGFVSSVIKSYNRHHHLTIRPDDVWFAILSQLSVYINKHAEELRGQFVAHSGKKELKITYTTGDRYTVDYGMFANEMGQLLSQNIVDKELRDWILPTFSTTEPQDTISASIIMMGAMQSYFLYKMHTMCGLPSVTLLGDKSDWQRLLDKTSKMRSWGAEPTQFCALLQPVLSRFISSFDHPTSPETIDFWQRIVSEHSQGSGSHFYDGWITAFCCWDEDGHPLFDDKRKVMLWHPVPDLVLDGVRYHRVDTQSVPPGYTTVPVLVDDNGVEFDAVMVAGSVGMRYTASTLGGPLDSVQPEVGWFMFEKDKKAKKRNRWGYLEEGED